MYILNVGFESNSLSPIYSSQRQWILHTFAPTPRWFIRCKSQSSQNYKGHTCIYNTVYTEDHADDSMFIPICCWLHRLPFFRSCYFCCCDCVSSLNILRAKDEHAHALVLVLPVLRNQFEIIQIIVLLIIWPIFWPLIERADDFAFSTSSDKKTVKLKYRLGVFINRISDHSITAHEDFDSEIRMI